MDGPDEDEEAEQGDEAALPEEVARDVKAEAGLDRGHPCDPPVGEAAAAGVAVEDSSGFRHLF